MSAARTSATVWIATLLTAGTLLAIALLAQTAINYRYVSNNLIEQEARRVASESVRALERAARVARPQTSTAIQVLLDDLRLDRSEQIASLVVRENRVVLATSGVPSAAPAAETARGGVASGETPLAREWRDGRAVLVGGWPCRCGLSTTAPDPAGRSSTSSRVQVEIALYRDGLSAPFTRLRRDAIVSVTAACTLLFALALIAIRFGPYVRAKQLEAQMDIAREVQRDLLPHGETQLPGVDVSATCVPASQVGGDFYDIVSLSGDRYAFLLGDVSGHGIPAALLMGLIHGAMSSPPWGAGPDEAERAQSLNRLVLAKSSGERYVSIFWCAFSPVSGTLRYLNAGHPPPLWLRQAADGRVTVRRLAEGGPVLGVLASAEYNVATVDAHAGDLLVIFSDGIVEAANGREEYFGDARLTEAILPVAGQSSAAIHDAIMSSVQAFTGARAADDDQTLVVVRLPGPDTTIRAPAPRSAAPAARRVP